MKEADILREIQVAVSTIGARVFRNNVGLFTDARGQKVRTGLCVGSSDLIGWTKAGQFLAIEVKADAGRVTPEQENFISMVNAAGGLAFVARCGRDAVNEILKRS